MYGIIGLDEPLEMNGGELVKSYQLALLPVDSRPCCAVFPARIAQTAGVSLLTPPQGAYRDFMAEADIPALTAWLREAAGQADALVFSSDMLAYGGLATSARCLIGTEEALERLEVIRELKREHPALKIYAASSLQRTSTAIFNHGDVALYNDFALYSELCDKLDRYHRPEDARQLEEVTDRLPAEDLQGYLRTRQRGLAVNRRMVEWAAEGLLEFVILGQNDTGVYSLARREQRELMRLISDKRGQSRCILYPGCDEMEQVLVMRALLRQRGVKPRVFVRYSSVLGPTIVSELEDIPVGENVRSQIYALGGVNVDSPEAADILLLVNTAAAPRESLSFFGGRSDAWEKRSPSPEHNLWDFVSAMGYYLDTGRRVAVADLAFPNGCDIDLIRLMEETIDLTRLAAFSGWNTAGNALGTALAHAAARFLAETGDERTLEQETVHREFLLERFADDYLYQDVVRPAVNARLEQEGTSVVNLGRRYPEVEGWVVEQMEPLCRDFYQRHFYGRQLDGAFSRYRIGELSALRVNLPWSRTFEAAVACRLTAVE